MTHPIAQDARHCIDSCNLCATECGVCFSHMVGKESVNACPSCCIECAAICRLCADAIARNSPFAKQLDCLGDCAAACCSAVSAAQRAAGYTNPCLCGNLDTQSANNVFDLLREISSRGTTFLIVTHDPRLAARCDRLIELVDGRVESDKATVATRLDRP